MFSFAQQKYLGGKVEYSHAIEKMQNDISVEVEHPEGIVGL